VCTKEAGENLKMRCHVPTGTVILPTLSRLFPHKRLRVTHTQIDQSIYLASVSANESTDLTANNEQQGGNIKTQTTATVR